MGVNSIVRLLTTVDDGQPRPPRAGDHTGPRRRRRRPGGQAGCRARASRSSRTPTTCATPRASTSASGWRRRAPSCPCMTRWPSRTPPTSTRNFSTPTRCTSAAEQAEVVLHLTEWADYRAIDPADLGTRSWPRRSSSTPAPPSTPTPGTPPGGPSTARVSPPSSLNPPSSPGPRAHLALELTRLGNRYGGAISPSRRRSPSMRRRPHSARGARSPFPPCLLAPRASACTGDLALSVFAKLWPGFLPPTTIRITHQPRARGNRRPALAHHRQRRRLAVIRRCAGRLPPRPAPASRLRPPTPPASHLSSPPPSHPASAPPPVPRRTSHTLRPLFWAIWAFCPYG